MEIDFWLLDITHKVFEGIPEVQLWGIADDGRRVLILDRSFKPYFYLLVNPGFDVKEAMEEVWKASDPKSPIVDVEAVDRRYLGKPVKALKVSCQTPDSIPIYKEVFAKDPWADDVLEADVRPYVRYMIDNGVFPCGWHRVEVEAEAEGGRGELQVDAVYKALKAPEALPRADVPSLRLLSFDIECYNPKIAPKPSRDPVIIISAVTNTGIRRQFTALGYDDRKVLEGFVDFLREFDPDVVVGYRNNSFGWPYLMDRAKGLNVGLGVSREGSEPQPSVYGHVSIAGRANMDMLNYAEDLAEVKVKTLENVADYLGVKPRRLRTLIEATEVYMYWDDASKRQALLKHAIEDAESIHGIAERALPFSVQLAGVTGLPLDQALAAPVGFRVEWYLMRQAFLEGELAPNRVERPYAPYKGAVVLKPRRGLHENISVMDFSAMYPNLMIQYNISPDTYIPPGEPPPSEGFNMAPEVGHRFRREPPGFYKRVLENLLKVRAGIREQMKGLRPDSPEHLVLDNRQKAIKIIANACYGYMGWVGARWHVKPCAEATTAYGREAIMEAVKLAKECGLDVIYSDTDSLFVKHDADKVKEFIDRVYDRTSLEIKVDKIYKTCFFTEAAKKYAGLTLDGFIDVVGFEAVRGDWCELSKEVQMKVLELILMERSPDGALRYVHEVVDRLRRGDVSIRELVIWKKLTKAFEDYDVEAVHVAAARKLMEAGYLLEVGDKVGYVITKGPGKLSSRATPYVMVKGCDEIDLDYYIAKQVAPSALRVLEHFNVTQDQLIVRKRQASLFDYMH